MSIPSIGWQFKGELVEASHDYSGTLFSNNVTNGDNINNRKYIARFNGGNNCRSNGNGDDDNDDQVRVMSSSPNVMMMMTMAMIQGTRIPNPTPWPWPWPCPLMSDKLGQIDMADVATTEPL